jgi:predicted nucleic acid-binding protein
VPVLVDSSLWLHQLRKSGNPTKLLPDYEISAEVWHRSIQLADRARTVGVTVPLADLLIFVCAKIHNLEVAHDDTHFDELAKLPT